MKWHVKYRTRRKKMLVIILNMKCFHMKMKLNRFAVTELKLRRLCIWKVYRRFFFTDWREYWGTIPYNFRINVCL